MQADKRVGPHPRVVVLEGSPLHMGFTHGRLLRNEIRNLLAQVEQHVFRRVDPVRGSGLRILTRALVYALNVHVPPRLRTEIHGVAMGSGVKYRDLLLLNSLDDVLNILRRFAPTSPGLACSSFAIFGTRTSDGSVLHGRNLDYHFRGTPLDDGGAVARLLLENSVLFIYRPHGHAAFASMGWPGIVGVSTAINEHGVVLGNLTSYLRGTTPYGTPATMLYRRVAEEAETIRKAGSILRASRRTIGNNLLVSSGRENEAVLFEVTMNTVNEVFPEQGVLVATNHFSSPSLARAQHPYLLAHSVTRWERLRALCAREGIRPEEAAGFLADCTCAPDGNPFSRIANEGTAVSVLFRPFAEEMWLGVAPQPPASRADFLRIDLHKLLALPTGAATNNAA